MTKPILKIEQIEDLPISKVTGLQTALDNVEQTPAEIKAALESLPDTNTVTDAQLTAIGEIDDKLEASDLNTINGQSLIGGTNIVISGGAVDLPTTVIKYDPAITDYTTILQTALDAGGNIDLQKGIYVTTARLNLNLNNTFVNGNGAKITSSTTFRLMNFNNLSVEDDFTFGLKNLSFESTVVSPAVVNVETDRDLFGMLTIDNKDVKNGYFENLTFTNPQAYTNAIKVIATSNGTEIQNLYFENIDVVNCGQMGIEVNAHGGVYGLNNYVGNISIKNFNSKNLSTRSKYGMALSISGNVHNTDWNGGSVDGFKDIAIENVAGRLFKVSGVRVINPSTQTDRFLSIDNGTGGYQANYGTVLDNMYFEGNGTISTLSANSKIIISNSTIRGNVKIDANNTEYQNCNITTSNIIQTFANNFVDINGGIINFGTGVSRFATNNGTINIFNNAIVTKADNTQLFDVSTSNSKLNITNTKLNKGYINSGTGAVITLNSVNYTDGLGLEPFKGTGTYVYNNVYNQGVRVDVTSLADNAVTTAKIIDNAVTTGKVVANAITTVKIADGNITEPKINALAVTSAKLADNAVTTAKIANSAVSGIKMLDGTITEAKLATEVTDKLNQVGSSELTPISVTASRVAVANDASGVINANSASPVIITVNTGTFPVTTVLTIRQEGVGVASFAGTGVPTAQTYIVGETYSIWQTATDVWKVINQPIEAVESGVTGIVKQELTADYTATINDLGKLFYNTGATNYEFTIPDNATVDYSGNGAFRFVQFGTGKIQVNKAAAVTAPTMESVTANIPFEYIETATDVWRVIGSTGSYVAYTPSGGGGGNLYTEANAANADTDDNSIGNWVDNNNTAITVGTTDVNDGTYALRFEQTGAGIYAEARDGSPEIFTIGNSYTVTFDAKVTGNTSDSVVYINGVNSTETVITNTWDTHTITFTALATAHQLRVGLSNGTSNPNGTVVLLDNINIVQN